jgi:hypothetical protein
MTKTPAPLKRTVALGLAGLMFLTACGGDDTVDAASDTTVQDETSATTAAPNNTTAAPETTEAPSGDSGSDFCNISREIDRLDTEISNSDLSMSETFRLQFETLIPLVERAAAAAPSDLDVDWDLYLATIRDFDELLSSVDYNMFALTEEQVEGIDSVEMDAADAAISEYSEQVCGIVDDESADADVALTEEDVDAILASPQRDAVLGGFTELGMDEATAECVFRATFSLDDGTGDIGSSPAFLEALTGCGVTAGELAELGLSLSPEDAAAAAGAFDEIAALIPLLADNPEMAAMLVPVFTSLGMDADEAQCAVEALTNPENIDAMGTPSGFTDMLEGCGLTLAEITELGE